MTRRLLISGPKIWFSKISHYCLYELPPGYVLSSKVKVLPALKEWAYLAPNVFTPDRIFLDKYKLHPKEYFFVREVSVGTVNYTGQHVGAVMGIASENTLMVGKCAFFGR